MRIKDTYTSLKCVCLRSYKNPRNFHNISRQYLLFIFLLLWHLISLLCWTLNSFLVVLVTKGTALFTNILSSLVGTVSRLKNNSTASVLVHMLFSSLLLIFIVIFWVFLQHVWTLYSYCASSWGAAATAAAAEIHQISDAEVCGFPLSCERRKKKNLQRILEHNLEKSLLRKEIISSHWSNYSFISLLRLLKSLKKNNKNQWCSSR